MTRAKSKLAKDLERDRRRLEKKRLTARAKAQLIFNINCFHDPINYDIVYTPESKDVIFSQLQIEFNGETMPIVWANREHGEVINRYLEQIPNITIKYVQ